MKPLLLIAQPGHELRILGWLKTYQPDIVILAQGEGSMQSSRLNQSQILVNELGLRIRNDYLSPTSDQEIYQTLLAGHGAQLLKQWFDSLCSLIKTEGFTAIVADAAEGYNPVQDLCRLLANLLTQKLNQEDYELLNLEFSLIGHPSRSPHNAPPKMEIHLSPEQLKDKIDISCQYGAQSDQRFLTKIQASLDLFGEDAFKVESFFPAQVTPYEKNQLPVTRPYFEIIGEERKQQGTYSTVITAEHLRKIAQQFLRKNLLTPSNA